MAILHFSLLISASFILTFSRAISIDPTKPHSLKSFKIKINDQEKSNAMSCSYTLIIKTSCSSISYTRDKVSLAFGDAYGNEVYAPRLDDPSSKIFEGCSTDTFHIQGSCMYEICYLYLLRVGSDGWKPESVKIYGSDRKVIAFNYNEFLPNGVWFGMNGCNNLGSLVVV